MSFLSLVSELFPALAAIGLAAAGWGWAKHLKRHAHDRAD